MEDTQIRTKNQFDVGDQVVDVVTGLKGLVQRRKRDGVEIFLDLNFRTRLYPWKGPESAYRRLRVMHP